MRARDRGAREALEQALGEAQDEAAGARIERDRVDAALAGVSEAVIVVDTEGTVVLRNTAADRFHGARHGDAVAEAAIARVLDRARSGDSIEEELSLVGPPRQSLAVRAAPLRSGSELLGAAAFVRDVSDLRRVESVRRDFVANVSHELKTPIGALAVLAETIVAGDDLSAVRGLSERLVREADRLARIVDDLLDLSLIEAEETPTREQRAVRYMVEEAVDRVRPSADARGIPISVDLPADELVLTCDPKQVTSALANLIDNAVKYSDEGQRVEITVAGAADRLVVDIRDHGIGIPTRDLERVFERFYRVDRARSRATGGTGLGLSIVRNVAQAHGGSVTVDSDEGEGSTFRLVLPLSAQGGPRQGTP